MIKAKFFTYAILSLLVLININCFKKGDDLFNIGVAVPFTGQEGAAIYGKNVKQAIEMAFEEINSKGGVKGKKLKAIYEDDKLTPSVAVAAATKLVKVDKINIIIGAIASSSTIAMAQVADENKVIIISPGSTSHEISGISPYVFRTIAPDTYEGKIMAEFAKEKDFKKVGICFVDNAGTRGPAEVFRKEYINYGLDITSFEVLPQGSSDARSQITKILSTKPDAVYLLGYALELGTMIKQVKEQNNNVPILSFQVFEEPKVQEIAGEAAEGVIFTTPTIYESDAIGRTKEFIDKYKEKYGESPGIFSANSYDAIYLLYSIISKVGFDTEKIRKELSLVRNYDGASGKFDINEKGDSNQRPNIMIFKNGKIEKYK